MFLQDVDLKALGLSGEQTEVVAKVRHDFSTTNRRPEPG